MTDTVKQPARIPLGKVTAEARRVVDRVLADAKAETTLDVAAFNSSI